MEKVVSGFTFFSTFDSGNLARVEQDDADAHPLLSQPEYADSTEPPPAEKGGPLGPADHAFKIWTRPDCAGTVYENGNRTWFYFGFRHASSQYSDDEAATPNIRFTVMNLNKQSKLLSQGMAPIALVVPLPHVAHAYGKDKAALKQAFPQQWERVRDKPTYWTVPSPPVVSNATEEEASAKDGKATNNSSSSSYLSNFVMSFRVRCDPRATTYVAFTFPYSYRELQSYLGKLERRYGCDKILNDKTPAKLEQMSPKIYFHRELACRSLQGRRVELITLSDTTGISVDREPVLDKLFPEVHQKPRARKFAGKKVVFVSARVHPGETQSSFVMNGFMRFLLREQDPRALVLRRKYVFKLMPMLNPDGVVNGHYRTDTRGVNLNRVYGSPSFELHPPIFAARKLLLYAHHGKEVVEPESPDEDPACNEESRDECIQNLLIMKNFPQTPSPVPDVPNITYTASQASHWLRSSLVADPASAAATAQLPSISSSSSSSTLKSAWYEMTETSRFSEGDESIADFSVLSEAERHAVGNRKVTPKSSGALTSFAGAFRNSQSNASRTADLPRLSPRRRLDFETGGSSSQSSSRATQEDSNQNVILVNRLRDAGAPSSTFKPPTVTTDAEENANLDFPAMPVEMQQHSKQTHNQTKDSIATDDGKCIKMGTNVASQPPTVSSGLFLYVDIHGHASKRGIFMYGNHFTEIERQVGCMLLPKLMSINCAHFDFPACIFTEKNMYMKDRHTGAGREGSGRVSAFKATGLVQSYTLECNFNTGRLVNGIPCASRDAGRATPPPKLDHPPKYCPEVYEDSGKALAIAVLDLNEANPWTRLTCSAYKNLKGVRDWLRKYIKASAEEQNAKAAAAANGKHGSPSKMPSASPSRSLRSTSRRVRTFSASSALMAKRGSGKSPKAPTSPESYRPVSKIARKNSAQQCQHPSSLSSPSPRRGRPLHGRPSLGRSVSAVVTVAGKRRSAQRTASTTAPSSTSVTAASVVRVRSQSLAAGAAVGTSMRQKSRSRPVSPTNILVTFPRSRSRPVSPTAPMTTPRSCRSRPSSPTTSRRQSTSPTSPPFVAPPRIGLTKKTAGKTPKKAKKVKTGTKIAQGTSRKSSSTSSSASLELLCPQKEIAAILPASPVAISTPKKKPLKRVRRRKGGAPVAQ